MKSGFSIVIALLLCASGLAQPLVTTSFRVGSQNLDLVRYLDHSDPQALLLTFLPADSTIANAEQWMNRIYPLADKNGWIVISVDPGSADNDSYWKALNASLKAELGEKELPLYVLTEGVHFELLERLHADVSPVAAVVSITPEAVSAGDNAWMDNTPVAFILQDSVPAALIDSVNRGGAWSRIDWLTGGESSTDVVRLPTIDQAMTWCDSLANILDDSAHAVAINQKIGVTNTIPEVVREGRKIEVEVFVPRPADCTFQLTDLAGKKAWEEKGFKGRGPLSFSVPTRGLNWGVYELEVEVGSHINRHKIIIRG